MRHLRRDIKTALTDMRKVINFMTLDLLLNYNLKIMKQKKIIFTYSLLLFLIGCGFMSLLRR